MLDVIRDPFSPMPYIEYGIDANGRVYYYEPGFPGWTWADDLLYDDWYYVPPYVPLDSYYDQYYY